MIDYEEKHIDFRCSGRKDRKAVHVISVTRTRALCSCHGVDWCSHIDATLRHGERHMVPSEDHAKADEARRIIRGRLKPPADWQASWKDDRVWRGLAPPRSGERERMRWDGRPTICFVGAGTAGTREEYLDHAQSLGWRIVDKPSEYVTLVVQSATGSKTARGKLVNSLGLTSIEPPQWNEWCYDITNEVLDRIEFHGHDPSKRLNAA